MQRRIVIERIRIEYIPQSHGSSFRNSTEVLYNLICAEQIALPRIIYRQLRQAKGEGTRLCAGPPRIMHSRHRT
jgi:hypothetical protein